MTKLKNLKKKISCNEIKFEFEILKKRKKLEHQKEILSVINLFLLKKYSINETIKLVSHRYNLKKWLDLFEEGYSFYDILRKEKFDEDVLLIIRVAEKSCNITDGLTKSITLLEKKVDSQKEVLELMKYPIVLGSILLVAIIFISTFLIPQFEKVFVMFGVEENLMLIILLNLISAVPYIVVIMFLSIIYLYRYYKKLNKSNKMNFWFKTKYTKKYFLRVYEQLFVMHLSNLLSANLKYEEIFTILKNQKSNILLKNESEKILKKLEEGDYLYKSITKKYYSKELLFLLEDGEKNYTLKYNLENYLILMKSTQDKKNKKLLLLIQPLFYGIFGIVIILLYAMMFIPMFQLMDSL